jgi:hypothetical protein
VALTLIERTITSAIATTTGVTAGADAARKRAAVRPGQVGNGRRGDCLLGCQYEYHYWRPITAIRETADDGNPATTPDPAWVPMFATPGHPEYPSGHSCVSGAAAAVLADEFGDRTHFKMTSDLMFGFEQSYRSIHEALEAVKDARVFAGIHFRKATEVGQALGKKVAEFVLQERFQRIH